MAPQVSVSSAVMPRSARIGRYVVLEPLDRDTTSEVYAAYDPELARKVALRLMPRDAHGGGRLLLQRARSLARLSHPNLAGVFDTGTVDEQVFVASELVEGPTLEAWMRGGERPAAELLGCLAQAGSGLLAAHEAGLAHGCFGPEHVILSRDGRVVLTGFDGRCGAALAEVEGGAPDPRAADVFAFCRSARGVLHAEPLRGVRDRGGSASLRAVLQQVLEPEDQERAPSMAVVLEELRRELRRPRRRRAAVAAGAIALVAAGALAFAWTTASGGDQAQLCAGAESKLAGIWDPSARAALRAGFRDLNLPYAEPAAERATSALDEYAVRWAEAHRAVCRATRVQGTQSEELMDLRMFCLGRLRADLGATVAVLRAPDAIVAQNAVQAVGALGSIEACVTGAIDPRGARRLPQDSALRERLARAEEDASRARALAAAGKFADAASAGHAAVEAASSVGDPLLEAEALLALATGHMRLLRYDDAESAFHRALERAEAARSDPLRTRALIQLARLLGAGQLRFREAALVAELAEAALRRVGDDRELRGDLSVARGTAASQLARVEAAVQHFADARADYEAVLPPGHAKISDVLLRSCSARARAPDPAIAEADCLAAQALLEQTYGEDHPFMARVWSGLARLWLSQAKYTEAEGAARRAATLYERSVGPHNRGTLTLRGDLALTLHEQRRFEEAREILDRNLAIAAEHFPGDDHVRYRDLYHLAGTHLFEGRPELALPLAEQAIAIVERTAAQDDLRLRHYLTGLAQVQRTAGRPRQALATLERALDLAGEQEAGHAGLPFLLQQLAETDLALQRPAEALEAIERASALSSAHGVEARLRAAIAFTRAKALAARGRPAEALAAARAALGIYAALGRFHSHDEGEVAAWIAAHSRAPRGSNADRSQPEDERAAQGLKAPAGTPPDPASPGP